MKPRLPKVYLARHGQTEWSLSGQHTGNNDIPLTPQGEEEAKRLGERLRDLSFAYVFTSPLQRAKRTCEIAGFGNRAEIATDILEWDYGDWEGLTHARIQEKQSSWNLFEHGAPGGETPEQVRTRVDRFLDRLRHLEGDSLVFAHGHILRCLGIRWVNLPLTAAGTLALRTATLSILGYDHNLDEPVIEMWNA